MSIDFQKKIKLLFTVIERPLQWQLVYINDINEEKSSGISPTDRNQTFKSQKSNIKNKSNINLHQQRSENVEFEKSKFQNFLPKARIVGNSNCPQN